jgi:RNA polymerase sigma-70 factor (ECF subfamily)
LDFPTGGYQVFGSMAVTPQHAAPEQRPDLDCERLFESLYRRYEGDIYEFALRLVGRREDAEDVTQAAFLNAYRALARGNRPRAQRAWMLAITRNVCTRRFRAQQRRPREVQIDPEVVETPAGRDGPTAEEVRSALQTLSPQQRSALVLRELHEMSYADIAARLGLSVSAVETLLFRSRRALRRELETADIIPSVPARSAEARRRRTIGGLLPCPAGLGNPFSWLGCSLARVGLGRRAAGITAAAVVGTSAVVGTGGVPFRPSPAGEPSAPAPGTRPVPATGLATVSDSSGRPNSQTAPDASPARFVRAPVREPERASPVTGAAPGSTAGKRSAPVRETQPPSVATPSPPPPQEPEAPSLRAPSLPQPPKLEVPSLSTSSLPPPPELQEPTLPALSLPPPPEIEEPTLPPSSAPPPPAQLP